MRTKTDMLVRISSDGKLPERSKLGGVTFALKTSDIVEKENFLFFVLMSNRLYYILQQKYKKVISKSSYKLLKGQSRQILHFILGSPILVLTV
jgi:hypothetical protein